MSSCPEDICAGKDEFFDAEIEGTEQASAPEQRPFTRSHRRKLRMEVTAPLRVLSFQQDESESR
jgi:hypothetical protein